MIKLPVPDVTELTELPSAFGGLVELRDVPAAPAPEGAAALAAAYLRERREPLQVLHLDDPRASVYGLFA